MALDEEIFCGRGEFRVASNVLQSSSTHPGWKRLKYVVNDSTSVNGGFEQRLKAIQDYVASIGQSAIPDAEVHPRVVCREKVHMEFEMARIQSIGGEVFMLRAIGSAYVSGHTSVLLKKKPYADDEAEVIGHTQGNGKFAGKMGAIECRLKNGITCLIGSGFTDMQRVNSPAVSSIITFRYSDKTKKGIPRQATFLRSRVDVDIMEFGNCV